MVLNLFSQMNENINSWLIFKNQSEAPASEMLNAMKLREISIEICLSGPGYTLYYHPNS